MVGSSLGGLSTVHWVRPGRADIESMDRERWIVVGTDFSAGSQYALEQALGVAQDSRAHVVLVHAYEDEPGASALADPTSKLLRQLSQEIAASSATPRGIRVEPLVRRGPPWKKILNVATEYGAEMIVVGRSGQRGATRGVVSRVLALSTRSVLVAAARGR
jgi:nucleotide-binding universal stress UspA family protein